MNVLKLFLIFLVFGCFLSAKEMDVVHEGDFFAYEEKVEVLGTVTGNVYVVGSNILISGHVLGNVFVIGGIIAISGIVEGNTQLAGGEVEILGTLKGDVRALAGNIKVIAPAHIGGNAIFYTANANVDGIIEKNFTLIGSSGELLGNIKGNVKARVGQLKVGSEVDINGNLLYGSHQKAIIEEGAKIHGKIVFKESIVTEFFQGKKRKILIFGSKFLGILMNFVFSFIIGSIFLKMFPNKLKHILKTLDTFPWKSFWIGLLMFIVLPLACILLLITILAMPIALALFVFGLFGFYAAKVFPLFWFTNTILSKIYIKKNSLWGFALVLFLFLLLKTIPFFGTILSFVVTCLGLGAAILGNYRTQKSA